MFNWSNLMLLLAAAFVSHAVRFVVLEPRDASMWSLGSSIPIRWQMDNVTLPYRDLRVRIDLYRKRKFELVYYRSISADLPNDGRYDWTMDPDLIPNADGFVIRVHSSDQPERHRAGDSDVFHILPLREDDRAIDIQAPLPKSLFYPDQTVNIEWTSGSTMPEFPYGIHAELRAASQALVSIARNTSTKEHGGVIPWLIPTDLPLQDRKLIFEGDIYLWGFDGRHNKLVFGQVMPIYIDYTDMVALTLRFVAPKQDAIWYCGKRTSIVLSLVARDDPNFTQERDVKLTLALYTDQNKHHVDIVRDTFISKDKWAGGTTALDYDVPQIPADLAMFRLVYQAEYTGLNRDKKFVIDGFSELCRIERQ